MTKSPQGKKTKCILLFGIRYINARVSAQGTHSKHLSTDTLTVKILSLIKLNGTCIIGSLQDGIHCTIQSTNKGHT